MEVRDHLDGCEWYEVYDIIEAICEHLGARDRGPRRPQVGAGAESFATEVNRYFRREGIGWQLVEGEILVRGPEAFEEPVQKALDALSATGLSTAAKELHEALQDLSRRPEPDVTGAIQHALAALECAARAIVANSKATLGEIIKRNPILFPPPLDRVVTGAWGFASERGRHLREGREPRLPEAELLVGLAASVATYVVRQGEGGA